MFKAQQVFKKHVFGEGPISIQVTSDQKRNFGGRIVNYEDPNLSVQLPIFIIHGNHDDPTREGHTEPLSAVDILAEAGLVNYFGRTDKTDDIRLRPVPIEKGPVKLALYGLGWIRDERLHRAFLDKKVIFSRVDAPEDELKNWYNVMLIHQNRAQKGRGEKNCVAESMIPEFVDFVIWGHEHECQIKPEEKGTYFLSQPGSSIAVSLIDGESRPKHIGVLEVKFDRRIGVTSRMIPVPLNSVRPFLLDTAIELAREESLKGDMPEMEKQDAVFRFLTSRVIQMLDEHSAKIAGEFGDLTDSSPSSLRRMQIPIVRLKVEHSGFPTINMQRFGAQFADRVANPGEILQFYKKKKTPIGGHKKHGDGMDDVLDEVGGEYDDGDLANDSPQDRIQRIAEQVLRDSAQKLELFIDQKLHLAVEEFVVKETTSAISELVEETMEAIQKTLKKDLFQTSGSYNKLTSEKAIMEAVGAVVDRERRKEELDRKKAEPRQELEALRQQAQIRTSAMAEQLNTDDDNDSYTADEFADEPKPKAKVAAKTSKAASKAPPTKRQRRSAKDEEEEEEEFPIPKVAAKGKPTAAANPRPLAVSKKALPSKILAEPSTKARGMDSDDDGDIGALLSEVQFTATAPANRTANKRSK